MYISALHNLKYLKMQILKQDQFEKNQNTNLVSSLNFNPDDLSEEIICVYLINPIWCYSPKKLLGKVAIFFTFSKYVNGKVGDYFLKSDNIYYGREGAEMV